MQGTQMEKQRSKRFAAGISPDSSENASALPIIGIISKRPMLELDFVERVSEVQSIFVSSHSIFVFHILPKRALA